MAAVPARFDNKVVAVAREIAINHKPIDDILAEYKISQVEWERLQANPDFTRVLQAEIIAWQGAENTSERTKLKAAALLEMWLEEAAARLYDGRETLSSKVELAKLIEKMSGISASNAGADVAGGFRITINIGEGMRIEKEVTSKVIDAHPEGV